MSRRRILVDPLNDRFYVEGTSGRFRTRKQALHFKRKVEAYDAGRARHHAEA